jgi:hypothetical protein
MYHIILILTLSHHMESDINNTASPSSSHLHPLLPLPVQYPHCLVSLEQFAVASWVARHLGKPRVD